MGKPRVIVDAKAYPSPMGGAWTVDVTVNGSDEIVRGVCRDRRNVGKTAINAACEYHQVNRSQVRLRKVEYVV